mmetsp:Transcript_20895/g.58763  ORF Transcript_20895/g.58763 Transcript_20895/m.58763 type:complete len:210 (+) Transcript_20895:604-1233(+)|eukprot:CAMPEP_0119128568 /NCGR_PEP_ID=MMETSP1310-20130426/6671_1 /TAXON_ID=464262 /ORGANISM="Genus nov. species nov., Strain RCC2339" /LENGTH=209 /DNA_ID=CAMNT_0007118917 /DNA_START=565 /DNA_END=1194 /DNA_ORIENTATION=-
MVTRQAILCPDGGLEERRNPTPGQLVPHNVQNDPRFLSLEPEEGVFPGGLPHTVLHHPGARPIGKHNSRHWLFKKSAEFKTSLVHIVDCEVYAVEKLTAPPIATTTVDSVESRDQRRQQHPHDGGKQTHIPHNLPQQVPLFFVLRLCYDRMCVLQQCDFFPQLLRRTPRFALQLGLLLLDHGRELLVADGSQFLRVLFYLPLDFILMNE